MSSQSRTKPTPPDHQTDAMALLALPLGTLLERVLGKPSVGDADPWIDVRSDACPVSERRLIAAAKAGELDVSKVGRKLLVKQSALDAWLARHAIKPSTAEPQAKPVPSRIAHMVPRGGS